MSSVHLPRSEPQPGVLLVHGGGWHMGAPAMMRGYGILMARHGYPCVAGRVPPQRRGEVARAA